MKKILYLSLIFILIDQIFKHLITTIFLPNQSLTILKNFFSLTYVQNKGVAFSLLEGKLPFIIIMTIIVIIIIIKNLQTKSPTPPEIISYSLVIGGAIGNLIDRICYGYVIDFLDFHLFNYNFPIFNIADSFIVVGILILFLISLKESRDKHDSNQH